MPRSRSQGIIVALLLGTLVLIAYGSLYPFDFKPGAESLSIWNALTELSWARSGRGDRIVNLLLYAPLGFCLFLLLDVRMRRFAAILFSVAISLALSYSIEAAQVYIAQRVASYWDVVFNGAGGLMGAIAGIAWRELSERLRGAPDTSDSDRGALIILALWIVWRLWPFVPQLTIGGLKGAFQPLADPYFSTAATLHYLAWWTLLAHILFALVSAQRRIEALLAMIALVLAACVGITNHRFIASELLALTLLLPTLWIFNRLTPLPRRWLLLLAFLGLLLYDALTPFYFGEPSAWRFWPFLRVDGGFIVDWQWLARRACYFATFVWVLRQVGASFRTITVVVPVTALALEIAQLWIRGQSATAFEPVLALAIAWLIRALDRPRSPTLQRARSH